jgi:hypothetical protein
MRLGRLAHDPIELAAAPAHRFGAVPPPAKLDRSLADFGPEMYDNDHYSDCTAAALANCARGVAYLNGYDLIVDPGKPLAFYGSCVGNPPDLAATEGAIMRDVLNRQAHGFDIGPQTLYGQWGTIDPKARSALAIAMERLGPLYLGVTLREREMETMGLWDVQAGRDDGVVIGGHGIPAWCYGGLADSDIVQIGTWGRWQSVTWEWLMTRLDEAHGVVWRQLGNAAGFYNGVTVDGLLDAGALTQ